MAQSIADIWLLSITDEAVPDLMSSPLSADEWLRAERFATDELRSRWVSSRVGLRQILAKYLSIPAAEVPIAYRPCTACGDAHGKPILSGYGLSFNLSHTDRLAAVAVAADGELGIDLESPSTDRLVGTEHLWLSTRELKVLDRVTPTEHQGTLLRWWTAKEAVVKWSGEGLNRDLRSIEVADTDGKLLQVASGATLSPVPGQGLVGTLASSGRRRWRSQWWSGSSDA